MGVVVNSAWSCVDSRSSGPATPGHRAQAQPRLVSSRQRRIGTRVRMANWMARAMPTSKPGKDFRSEAAGAVSSRHSKSNKRSQSGTTAAATTSPSRRRPPPARPLAGEDERGGGWWLGRAWWMEGEERGDVPHNPQGFSAHSFPGVRGIARGSYCSYTPSAPPSAVSAYNRRPAPACWIRRCRPHTPGLRPGCRMGFYWTGHCTGPPALSSLSPAGQLDARR